MNEPLEQHRKNKQTAREELKRVIKTFVLVALSLLIYFSLPIVFPSCVPVSNWETARHQFCQNEIQQIGLALHHYHDEYQSFPVSFKDENGQPLHSWRVLILPYLDSSNHDNQKLYDRYRFEEPWDSPHNLTLHNKIGKLFQCTLSTEDDREIAATNYLALVDENGDWLRPRLSVSHRGDSGVVVMMVEVLDSNIHGAEPKDSSHQGKSGRTVASPWKSTSSYKTLSALLGNSTLLLCSAE